MHPSRHRFLTLSSIGIATARFDCHPPDAKDTFLTNPTRSEDYAYVIVMRYATDWIIEKFSADLETEKVTLFNKGAVCALILIV